MTTNRQQRIRPKPDQVKHAVTLLRSVPPLGLDWSSSEGQKFLAYVDGLTEQGVPVSWLAEQLKLNSSQLYAILTRYRRTVA